MRFSTLLPNFALLALAAAQHKGFNYGSTLTDGSAKSQAVFEAEFAAAKALPGTSGFNSARLYTCIQAGTTNTPIAAIPAAIAQDTTLLLGLWASAGEANIQNEIAALKAAITQYGTDFTSRVVGISVGSEDLYRTSTIGIAAMAGVGTTPDVLVNYIGQVRTALAGTALSGAKITHVDTYNAYTNGSNAAVIDAIDFISVDAYPFFQKEMDNRIDNGLSLFQAAYDEVVAVARSKDIWVTETGWPVSGDNQGAAQASAANAKTFWDAVGCGLLFGKVNTYWYVLQDALPTTPSPSFGLIPTGPVNAQPLYNLTCPAILATLPVVVSSSAATSSRASGRPAPPRASSSSQSVAVSGNPVILPAPTSRASSARTSATATTSRAAGGATTSSSRAAGGATTSAAASASAPTSTTGDAGSLHGSLLVAGLFGTLAIFMTL